MKSALLEFERTLDDLAALLKHDHLRESLLAYPDDRSTPSDLRTLLGDFRQSSDKFLIRQAQYSTQLVLLYGAFERLIEGLVTGFGDTISGLVPDFSELPVEVRNSHRRKSVEALHDEIWLSRQSDPNFVTKLIENLSSCENASPSYRLNSTAYSRHGANFRRSQIDDLFRPLGVADLCSSSVAAGHFARYLEEKPRETGLLDGSLGAIDDLAERRNEIAHGSPSEVLSLERLAEYLDFFRAYARALHGVLCQFLASFAVAHHASSLGTIQKVHYKHVVCVDTGILPEGTPIQVGNFVAMKLPGGRGYDIGEIVNVRLESGDTSSFRCRQGLEAAFEIDLQLRESRDIYLIQPQSGNVESLISSLRFAPVGRS